MNFLINGYFGFGNAGDEAVLAAMLADLRALRPNASFCVTSGNPAHTRQTFGCEAIARQAPREILSSMRACDTFISGGGSLVQDVTSVRNVVYYTSLIQLAKRLGKPTMVYAQGVGPLSRTASRQMARLAFSGVDALTVRDPQSAKLLREIGVSKAAEITADPVWSLEPPHFASSGDNEWLVALRSWPGADKAAIERVISALRSAAKPPGATLRFLPMQPGPDNEILGGLTAPGEIIDTQGKHPTEILRVCAGAKLMLAMRLHALIFAASAGVPVVAFDYDPKVSALATLLGAPSILSSAPDDLVHLPRFVDEARAAPAELIQSWRLKARRNAQIAVSLS